MFGCQLGFFIPHRTIRHTFDHSKSGQVRCSDPDFVYYLINLDTQIVDYKCIFAQGFLKINFIDKINILTSNDIIAGDGREWFIFLNKIFE